MEPAIHSEGSATPAKRRHKPRRASVQAAAAAAAGAADEDMPQASSSRLPEADAVPMAGDASQRSKRDKKRRKRLAEDGQPEASGSALPSAGESSAAPRRRKERKESKRAGPSLLPQAAGDDDDDDEGALPGWKCTPLARSRVSRIPHIWSRDGRFFFTASGTSIEVHSSTGPTYPTLSTLSSTHSKGHKQPITSLALHPTNPLQIISASEDGTVKTWDWVEGRLVKTVRVVAESDGGVGHMCVGEIAGMFFAFVTATAIRADKTGKLKTHGKRNDAVALIHRVYRIPLYTPKATPLELGKISNAPSAIFISPSSTYLVVLSLNKAYAYRLTDISSHGKPTSVKFVSDQPLTCGAFAPLDSLNGGEEWFATGDKKGVIRLWHGLDGAFRQSDGTKAAAAGPSDGEKRLPTTSLHWHAHAVAAIAFTTSGSQLLSVGEESVLVQWHLASGRREYIPRLGGRPLISLAVKRSSRGAEEEYWMSLTDGSTVRVGASSGKVHTIGHGVRLDPLRPTSDRPYPLALHPATSALVVPSSHPSTLQFIDPTGPSVLFDLEVSPSNRVSRRDEKEVEPIGVEQVAFSVNADGQSRWMATYEGKAGSGQAGTLKFWSFDLKYQLNTQFPQPHGAAPLAGLTFGPTPAPSPLTQGKPNPYVLTTATDGTAKLWQARQAKKSDQGAKKLTRRSGKAAKQQAATERADGNKVYWSMRSSFDYRGLAISGSAFSADGTIVALAHGSVISLWDVESCALLRTLAAGSVTDLTHVVFVGKEGRYVVGGGDTGVAVWDLLSCEVLWSNAKLHVRQLLAIPSSTNFIVACDINSQLTAFNIFGIAAPTSIRDARLPHHFREITLLTSRSAPVDVTRSINLIGVTSSGEIYRFGDNVPVQITHTRAVKADGPKGTSIWQEMFGKDAFIDELVVAPSAPAEDVIRPRSGRPTDVFDGPSHTMPPVSLLFDAFMNHILQPKAASSGDNVAVTAEDDKIIFEQDTEAVKPAVTAVKPRVISDQELTDLETLFRGMSSASPSGPETPAAASKTSTNGRFTSVQKGKTPPSAYLNGKNGTVSDNDDEDAVAPSLVTPVNAKAARGTPNGPGSAGTPRGKADSALRSAIKLTSSAQKKAVGEETESEGEGAEVMTPVMSGGDGRGKKRKARQSIK